MQIPRSLTRLLRRTMSTALSSSFVITIQTCVTETASNRTQWGFLSPEVSHLVDLRWRGGATELDDRSLGHRSRYVRGQLQFDDLVSKIAPYTKQVVLRAIFTEEDFPRVFAVTTRGMELAPCEHPSNIVMEEVCGHSDSHYAVVIRTD